MTFTYHKAKTLAEAVALGATYSDLPVLAGGTDLIAQKNSGLIDLHGVVDISGVDELKVIKEEGKTIEIGALATHADILKNEAVLKYLPLLAQACSTIGAAQIQNRGTIGGNIMNASPAGDTPPVLMVYESDFMLRDLKSERWVPSRDFFTAYRQTAKRPDELLTRIRLKKANPTEEKTAFYKIGTRRAQAISKIVMAVRGRISHGGIEWINIALGSVAPTVVRANGTEALLKGKVITQALIEKARRSLHDEFHPIDDVRSTADYRRFVCGSLIAKFLRGCISKKS